MARQTLTSAQIHSLISSNKYEINPKTKYLSRCIDGRYENSAELPALAIPGGDAGDLAILYATAKQYALEVDYDKALATLQSIVGKNNFSWHSDEHGELDVLGAGCGHIKNIRLDPEAYFLDAELVELLNKQLVKAQSEGGTQTVLKGKHQEAAVILINGDYGVLPTGVLETDEGKVPMQIFEFHRTLVDQRHREWVKLLLEADAIKMFENLDEEYLYEVLSNTTDDHLFETSRRLAKDLPIYQATFKEDGSFDLLEMGPV